MHVAHSTPPWQMVLSDNEEDKDANFDEFQAQGTSANSLCQKSEFADGGPHVICQ